MVFTVTTFSVDCYLHGGRLHNIRPSVTQEYFPLNEHPIELLNNTVPPQISRSKNLS